MEYYMHPWKLNGWNLKETSQKEKEKHLNQTANVWVPLVDSKVPPPRMQSWQMKVI